MSQEHEQEQTSPKSDSPQFIPSPAATESGPPPEASAYGNEPIGQKADRHDNPKPADPPSSRQREPAQPAAPPQQASATSLLSGAVMMVVGAAIAAGTYGLARVYAPPKPAGEVAGPPADMAKTEDLKKLTDRIDQMTTELNTAKKQIADRPDYSPELKMQRDRVNELDRSIASIPAQIDSINQKLATVTKIEDSSAGGRVDALDKKVTDLAQAVETMRNSPGSAVNSSPIRPTDLKLDMLAMQGAIDLFKAKKWSEARDAFAKLQSQYPNDATVWYYSALCNGFATGQWLGETERLVTVGLAKEKAGQPNSSTIDSAFSGLTRETGKDWLAGYRQRIGSQ